MGKTQGGRVKDGKPQEKASRRGARYHRPSNWRTMHYNWAELSKPEYKHKVIEEAIKKGWYYPFSKKDLLETLEALPGEVTKDVRTLLLAMPSAECEEQGVLASEIRNCIVFYPLSENIDNNWLFWPDPLDQEDLAVWCSVVKGVEGQLFYDWTAEELKKFYLHSVLLHEIGHVVQGASEEGAEAFAVDLAKEMGWYPGK